MAREWHAPRDAKGMAREELDRYLGEWKFQEVGYGDWQGQHPDGRKTCLKRGTKTHTAMQMAQNDVLNGRIVCPAWPHCEHYVNGERAESIEACVVAARKSEQHLAALGLKQGDQRQFRGRREYSEL